jgi:hypothetical protein
MFNNSEVTETMIKLPYIQKNTREREKKKNGAKISDGSVDSKNCPSSKKECQGTNGK